METSMLRVQADVIKGELKVLEVAVWSCETGDLPETARQLRLTMDILQAAARLIEREADELDLTFHQN